MDAFTRRQDLYKVFRSKESGFGIIISERLAYMAHKGDNQQETGYSWFLGDIPEELQEISWDQLPDEILEVIKAAFPLIEHAHVSAVGLNMLKGIHV